MIKTKKILLSILLFASLIVTIFLAGCKNLTTTQGNVTTTKENVTTTEKITQAPPSDDNTEKNPEEHEIDGTLHKVSVTDSDITFTRAGMTDYKIVYDDTNYYQETAASFIMNHVKKATGASLSISLSKNTTWEEDAKYIVLGDKEMFNEAGLTMPKDNIGFSGYYVKTVNNSAFIMTNGNDGFQLGAIAFLRAVLGYDMIYEDCVVYEKSGNILPNIEIIEKPDYDFRQNPNKMKSDCIYGMGFNADSELWITVGGSTLHNSFSWLPLEKYLTSHPKWYSDNATLSDRIGEEAGQLCYTAHGDEAELDLMIEQCFESAKTAIKNASNPNAKSISLTIQDNPKNCNCEACQKEVEKYGYISSTVIKFLNRLDNKIQNWLEEEAMTNDTPKKELNLIFFAYYATETPPVIKNEDGTFSPVDDSVICNEHVGVYIAPISAIYNKSFYDEKNTSYADNIRGWSVLSNLVYLWLYQTNFNHYLYPMDNWDVIADNYRFGKENNAIFIYDEGQINQPTATHFTRLKDYIASKTEFDLNSNYSEIVDKYFKYYFREAAPFMRQFFDELQAYLRFIEAEYPDKLTGGIRDKMASSDLWKQATLEHWMDLINQSMEAIKKYESTDPEMYQMLSRHIRIESVFPKYALCTLYEGTFDQESLYNMRLSLRNDCLELGVERAAEWELINQTFKSWGF